MNSQCFVAPKSTASVKGGRGLSSSSRLCPGGMLCLPSSAKSRLAYRAQREKGTRRSIAVGVRAVAEAEKEPSTKKSLGIVTVDNETDPSLSVIKLQCTNRAGE